MENLQLVSSPESPQLRMSTFPTFVNAPAIVDSDGSMGYSSPNSMFSDDGLKMKSTPTKVVRLKPYSKPSRKRSTSESSNEVDLLVKTDKEGSLHRCVTCGKAYKNESCLLKHNWEHTEYWELAKQHCASKHQSVQLLEAARILLCLVN